MPSEHWLHEPVLSKQKDGKSPPLGSAGLEEKLTLTPHKLFKLAGKHPSKSLLLKLSDCKDVLNPKDSGIVPDS